MKHLDEYRDRTRVARLSEAIHHAVTRPWVLMEICGGQTHSIVKYGLEGLLPRGITLVHGPGCPVCVTPVEMIDRAISIASRPGVILASFGDMLRVPGSSTDLLSAKAGGADVRVVYSPLDAVQLAAANPGRPVVFFAIGFETTAPANAMAVWHAREIGLTNFSILCSQVLVPPALEMILSAPGNRVQGILAAGHVCTVTGISEYHGLADRYRVPIVVTGFEPVDILQGVLLVVRQLEQGSFRVENQYARSVLAGGNRRALDLVRRVFEVCDRTWRGIGMIPSSGYALRPEFARFDAGRVFEAEDHSSPEPEHCKAGEVLRGIRKPVDCPAFGSLCAPEHPLGAPMVSSEGACAAYYGYKEHAYRGWNTGGQG